MKEAADNKTGANLLTPAQSKLLDAATDMQLTPATQSQVGYIARAVVLATLPHSRPTETVFTRQNGDYALTVAAGLHGLPYGTIPRLVLIWLCSEIVRTRKREIELGDSLSDFMRELDIVPTGGRWGSIKRLREQLFKLFSSTFSFTRGGADSRQGGAGRNMLITDEYQLWWEFDGNPAQMGLFQSCVTVSQRFFDEVLAAPIPFDLRALRALRKSPLALDLYIWTAFRVSYMKESAVLPWDQLALQVGAAYTGVDGMANFRRKVTAAMKKVKTIYPALHYELTPTAFVLHKSPLLLPRPRRGKDC